MYTTASVENFIDSVGALALCCAIAAKLLPRAGPTGRFLSRHCRTPKPARAPETVAHATAPGRVSQRPIAGAQPLPFLTLPGLPCSFKRQSHELVGAIFLRPYTFPVPKTKLIQM